MKSNSVASGYPTVEALASHLRESRVLTDAAILRRAVLLAEDIRRIGMDQFALLPLRRKPMPRTDKLFTVVEYGFGPVRFSVENAKDPHSVRRTVEEISGSGLDSEDLVYFSKICEMARALIPRHWFGDDRLLANVRESGQHLSTLNEIWWLGRWNSFTEEGLEREYRLNSSSKHKIDWRFPLSIWGRQWVINLEVKCLVRSIADRSYKRRHYFYRATKADGSDDEDDPRRKFRKS